MKYEFIAPPTTKRSVDYTGLRHGMVTVLGYVGNMLWAYQCNCGNLKTTTAGHLKRGRIQSCGCADKIDRTNLRYGRLVCIKYLGNRRWLCRCDCGIEKSINSVHLVDGHTQSCGCLNKELTIQRNKSQENRLRTQKEKTTHGMSHSTEFRIWANMLDRCHRPNNKSFKDYGGRGITICDSWSNSFEAFYQDMGQRPSSNHSLDRIDNSLGYSLENCRWATRLEQANNKRNNRMIIFGDKTLSLAHWAREIGISHSRLFRRIERHGIEKALSMPKG